MQCDMCGKETELMIALIEGTELKVCSSCGRFGKILRRAVPAPRLEKKEVKEKKPALPEKEVIEMISEDYAKIVKQAREKTGLKQEDFAKKINEKEAIIHKIETGKFKPTISLARKLERALGVKIIEQHEEVHGKKGGSSGDIFTIGDVIRIKKQGKEDDEKRS